MSEQNQGYMQEVDAWLDELNDDERIDWEEMKRQIKQKLLESYHNGQAAGPAKRSFKSTQK